MSGNLRIIIIIDNMTTVFNTDASLKIQIKYYVHKLPRHSLTSVDFTPVFEQCGCELIRNRNSVALEGAYAIVNLRWLVECVGGVVVTRSPRMSDVRGSNPGTVIGYAPLMSSNKSETRLARAMRSHLPPPQSSVNETAAATTSVRRAVGSYS
ncbi:hypothetical protein T265_01940 [Opisthorchis viverrini]|uniref:Uncharacterized protein n=1 Tax=Opisthorchis viverrini TaxID=6198 RepID=A0A075A827_OPIVI|nr:hypothetical protein T265_01940 [Opisthorchis viverrini]KER31850.1 hypothetical protein T265_01940 [Opisthorchis viverrini]